MMVNGCPPFTLPYLLPETRYELYVRKAVTAAFSNNSCPVIFETAACRRLKAWLRILMIFPPAVFLRY